MDRVSIFFVRAGLLWLLSGFILGGLMLSDNVVPGDWRLWFAPSHGHMLFVGWFMQFAIGVGYWLLPRKRSPERPEGYHEPTAFVAFVLLNAGLLVRVATEPWTRTGHSGLAIDLLLGSSSILQVGAILIIVPQIWRRIIARKKRVVQDHERRAG